MPIGHVKRGKVGACESRDSGIVETSRGSRNSTLRHGQTDFERLH